MARTVNTTADTVGIKVRVMTRYVIQVVVHSVDEADVKKMAECLKCHAEDIICEEALDMDVTGLEYTRNP